MILKAFSFEDRAENQTTVKAHPNILSLCELKDNPRNVAYYATCKKYFSTKNKTDDNNTGSNDHYDNLVAINLERNINYQVYPERCTTHP